MNTEANLFHNIEKHLIDSLIAKGFDECLIIDVKDSLREVCDSQLLERDYKDHKKDECSFLDEKGFPCCREAYVSTIYGPLCARHMNNKFHTEFTKRVESRGLTEGYFYTLLEKEENVGDCENFIPVFNCCWFVTRVINGERVYCNEYTYGKLCDKHQGLNGGDIVKLIK